MNRVEVLLDDASLSAGPLRGGWLLRDAGRRGELIYH